MTAIVDYGVGNLFSLSSSLKALGLETISHPRRQISFGPPTASFFPA